jgi:hypothetical protein
MIIIISCLVKVFAFVTHSHTTLYDAYIRDNNNDNIVLIHYVHHNALYCINFSFNFMNLYIIFAKFT